MSDSVLALPVARPSSAAPALLARFNQSFSSSCVRLGATIGFAACVLLYAAPSVRAESGPGQTATSVVQTLACHGTAIEAVAEVSVADHIGAPPTTVRLRCNDTIPIARNTGSIIINGMPWRVRLSVTDARGARTSCERSGNRVPARFECLTSADNNPRAIFEMLGPNT